MKSMAPKILTLLIIGLLAWASVAAGEKPIQPQTVAIDRQSKQIAFKAVVTAEKWQDTISGDDSDPDHWHLIISATQSNPAIERIAAFAAWATDGEISNALAYIGARGERFDPRSFSERRQKHSPYPDQRPQGTKIGIQVTWVDRQGKRKTVTVDDFLENPTGQKMEPVYIGKQNSSQCVVCLYGCIGAVCPNQSLTVRDYYERGHRWKLKKGVLPKDGSVVTIILQVKE